MAFSQSGNARRHERRCASLDNINNGGGLKNEDGGESGGGGEDENGGDGIKKEVKDEASNTAADSAGEREAAVEKRKREVNSGSYYRMIKS